jgi:phospholipid/cholesterol/gamma-HCH transport system ATP-binding protein
MELAKEKIEHAQSASTGEVVLKIRNLSKAFGSNQVLKNFSLDLFKGENLVVLGKSGVGKSVLIKCVIGLIEPDAGTIEIFGTDVGKLNQREMDKLRMRVGFLFQSNALYDSMTIRENLEFPLRRHRVNLTKKEVEERIFEALESVDLRKTIDMMPEDLSGGMKKRIALARTLILKPEIILYDEPTTGLDPITGKEISHLMLEIREKFNTSSIIISHDLNCVRIVASRIATLIEGRCYATGTYGELQQSEDKLIRQFFE